MGRATVRDPMPTVLGSVIRLKYWAKMVIQLNCSEGLL